MTENTFGCRVKFDDGTGSAQLYSLESLGQKMGGNISRLPFSMKILLEQALRNHDEFQVLEEHVRTLANWDGSKSDKEIPHKPTRVLLQDFTAQKTLHRFFAKPRETQTWRGFLFVQIQS